MKNTKSEISHHGSNGNYLCLIHSTRNSNEKYSWEREIVSVEIFEKILLREIKSEHISATFSWSPL